MKKFRFLLIILASHIVSGVLAQESILPVRVTQAPVMDGVLDDSMWQELLPYGHFIQQFPSDSIAALGDTQLKMGYDDENIYIGIFCKSIGNNFVVTSLKRDFSFRSQDNIAIVFDTYADNNNAFAFGINAYGARREALVSNGGQKREDFQVSWDNKWQGEAYIGDDYWSAEMIIPLKSIRFEAGSKEWNFNAYRNDTQLNEHTVYSSVPRNRLIVDLNYPAKIIWNEPLNDPGPNISLIPYLIGGATRDYEEVPKSSVNTQFNAGFDAKIGVTTGLNLDLTVNPDFSQVEVDEQVTNLDRFEIYFPEKRQFFLENADLFGSFGLSRVNPFFSRRIGVALDTVTGQNIQNAIRYGARLSGKINDRLRIGLLNMQSAPVESNGLPGFNYTVATLQQQVFDRSNISFILVNKQAINKDDYLGDYNAFNRVAGLEYRLVSADNKWRGKTFYHRVFSPDAKVNPYTQGATIEYQQRRFRLEWAHNVVGYGYDAEVGFVPRNDYLLMSPEAQLFFYPKSGIINTHSLNLDTRWFLQMGNDGNALVTRFDKSESQIELKWEATFLNTSRADVTITRSYLFLLNDFDPTRIQADGIVLPAGSEYYYNDVKLNYTSDQRQLFSFLIEPQVGQLYNGTRKTVNGNFTYRIQPYGSIGINYAYNDIRLADPFVPAKIWLVGPKIDLTFAKNVFFTTFIQYNNQLENMNVNARLQWRFAPVSDFFIVYTDNYITEFGFDQLSVRNRGIVAKFTYWLNL